MSTSTKRRNVASRTSFIASRMKLQSRKTQMQNDIEKLLSDKFSKTINDSTTLRLFKTITQLLSLLFIKKNDIRQKLININKKLDRIKNNIFKTKTYIKIYAIAIKIESLTNVDVKTTIRRDSNVFTIQQKIFMKIRKKKTMMIKINNEIKKIIIRIIIIKDLIQKLKTIEKKKKNILSIKRLFNDDSKLLARFEKTKERMKQNKEFLYDITSSTTTIRRTYVVLLHDVRINNVNIFNQQKIINQIVKQNNNLHKNLNIVQVV
jgi:hypothetical protein